MEQPYPSILYTSRDYAAIRQAMIDGIPVRVPEWTSRSPQDFGIVLIELFATMGDILSYYSDRVINEAFLATATQRDSVLRIAEGLNYRPRGTAAATTAVQFTTSGAALTIPAGTLLRSRTSDGSVPVIFSTDAVLTVPLNTTGGSVTVTHGQPVLLEQIGVATGNVDQSFALLQIPVVESSVTILLKESPASSLSTWSFVNNLIDARPDDRVHTSLIDANGRVTITFGDGVNGRIPPASAIVYATYRIGGGEVGNVAAGSIVEMVTPSTGVSSLTNAVAASGGTGAESTNAIRTNAPRSLAALNRAVTLEDYANLAIQVPQVAKANSESLVYSNVIIFIAPFGAGQPTQRLLNDVSNYFTFRRFAGVDVVAASPTYIGIDVTVTVRVNAAHTRTQVQSDVSEAVRDYLAFDNVDFGQRITVGDIYSVINAVEGVDIAELTQLSRRGEAGVSDVFIAANEIPTSGTLLSVNAVGGITAGDVVDITMVSPTAGAKPTLVLLRCDPTSVHLELSWAPGTNTTVWYVEIQYLNSLSVLVGSTVAGPVSSAAATVLFDFDIPHNEDAVTLSIRTQAYNSGVGPALSPILSVPNTCAT